MAKRERYVWVCTNRRPDGHPKGSCAASGGEDLARELKAACARAGLNDRVRVMTSSCLDLCWEAPAVSVMPDDVFLGHVSPADIPGIVEALASDVSVGEHPRCASHVLPLAAFDDPARAGG